MKRLALLGTIFVSVPLLAVAMTTHSVAYPEGYRSWTHVKSMVIHPDHGLADPFEGIHHVYANDSALAGLRSNTYEDGAVLVFDLLSQVPGGGATQEGERKFIGVMEYDAERFAATGGWGFEAFAGNSTVERAVNDGGASCFACHQGAKEDNYVFSKYRD
ncbi:MAG: cytochrome P460 family protein [Gammaproteobacteria bacterium]|nr:cytochrome P460 family protein [Gammaproteobacteria bacterium]MDH5303895.1 cytochrome P460 family protein [Gammaproteobacteria bacterium]MDH5322373.1 cytochrome P460 family protein [Gammaproteobacteria bacterium]